ncbi:MAG TPA: D-aminoacyl-tRNA deacylase [Thermoplasmata archaeon]|nr:D-aminoacyl-tRNA deacylase [Thermoplasmata archaeon]
MGPLLLVVAESDPVAVPVAARWGTPPATGDHVDGAPIRRLAPGTLLLRRPGPHIHDERLDRRLPRGVRDDRPTLVFPSIHRSEQNVASLTVHPLGNPGPTADVGGEPGRLVPTDPARMAAALRALAEGAAGLGLSATFEATHHGPALDVRAFFVEIGYGTDAAPPEGAVALLARVLPDLAASGDDRVALAIGGGHYAPHFTDLVLSRRWAVGHILSRHALEVADRSVVAAAWDGTPGAAGILYARAADAERPNVAGIAGRLRDGDAPPRPGSPTPAGRSTSGT